MRSIQAAVIFSARLFWRSRSFSAGKSTRSSCWSWLKQENTTVRSPVSGLICGCRHCAQTSFIMHCIGLLIDPTALCPGISNGASTPCRAAPTACIMRSEPMTIMCAASASGTACAPNAPEP